MPIRIDHSPSPLFSGPVALGSGFGKFKQRQSEFMSQEAQRAQDNFFKLQQSQREADRLGLAREEMVQRERMQAQDFAFKQKQLDETLKQQQFENQLQLQKMEDARALAGMEAALQRQRFAAQQAESQQQMAMRQQEMQMEAALRQQAREDKQADLRLQREWETDDREEAREWQLEDRDAGFRRQDTLLERERKDKEDDRSWEEEAGRRAQSNEIAAQSSKDLHQGLMSQISAYRREYDIPDSQDDDFNQIEANIRKIYREGFDKHSWSGVLSNLEEQKSKLESLIGQNKYEKRLSIQEKAGQNLYTIKKKDPETGEEYEVHYPIRMDTNGNPYIDTRSLEDDSRSTRKKEKEDKNTISPFDSLNTAGVVKWHDAARSAMDKKWKEENEGGESGLDEDSGKPPVWSQEEVDEEARKMYKEQQEAVLKSRERSIREQRAALHGKELGPDLEAKTDLGAEALSKVQLSGMSAQDIKRKIVQSNAPEGTVVAFRDDKGNWKVGPIRYGKDKEIIIDDIKDENFGPLTRSGGEAPTEFGNTRNVINPNHPSYLPKENDPQAGEGVFNIAPEQVDLQQAGYQLNEMQAMDEADAVMDDAGMEDSRHKVLFDKVSQRYGPPNDGVVGGEDMAKGMEFTARLLNLPGDPENNMKWLLWRKDPVANERPDLENIPKEVREFAIDYDNGNTAHERELERTASIMQQAREIRAERGRGGITKREADVMNPHFPAPKNYFGEQAPQMTQTEGPKKYTKSDYDLNPLEGLAMMGDIFEDPEMAARDRRFLESLKDDLYMRFDATDKEVAAAYKEAISSVVEAAKGAGASILDQIPGGGYVTSGQYGKDVKYMKDEYEDRAYRASEKVQEMADWIKEMWANSKEYAEQFGESEFGQGIGLGGDVNIPQAAQGVANAMEDAAYSDWAQKIYSIPSYLQQIPSYLQQAGPGVNRFASRYIHDNDR